MPHVTLYIHLSSRYSWSPIMFVQFQRFRLSFHAIIIYNVLACRINRMVDYGSWNTFDKLFLEILISSNLTGSGIDLIFCFLLLYNWSIGSIPRRQSACIAKMKIPTKQIPLCSSPHQSPSGRGRSLLTNPVYLSKLFIVEMSILLAVWVG